MRGAKLTPCCSRRIHRTCYQHHVATSDHCGHCRAPFAATIPDGALTREQQRQQAIGDLSIYYWLIVKRMILIPFLFFKFQYTRKFPDSIPYMMLRIHTFEPHFNLTMKLYTLITSMKQVLMQNNTHEIHQICYYSVYCRYSLSAILYLFFPHSMLDFFSFRIMDDYSDYLRLRSTFSIHH